MKILFALFMVVLLSCNDTGETKTNKTLPINNVSIAYNECGKRDTTLLFVHGWCINKEYWNEQIKYFCDRYNVVTIDLPGFGHSGKNRKQWTIEQYADDISEFIKAKELKNVILVGHSMSGDILLLADTKFPTQLIGIVGVDNLQSPGRKFTEEDIKQNEAIFSEMEKNFTASVDGYARKFLFPPLADSAIVNRVANDFKKSDSVISVKVLRSVSEAWQNERDLMQKLSHKLYLVNSDMNPTQIDSLRKYCRASAEVVYVKGTGHYPMIEKTTEFNQAFEKVLELMGRK